MSNTHAFPTGIGTPGMTQRQWYKGQILVGALNSPHSDVYTAQLAARIADEALAEDAAFERSQKRVDGPNTSA